MTAPNMVTLLNKRAEMYKAPGSSRGADPAEVRSVLLMSQCVFRWHGTYLPSLSVHRWYFFF